MKIIFAAALLFSMGFIGTDTIRMPGAYKMLSQSVKGANIDTNYNSVQQLKIYTDSYMMYANFNPVDSSSGFGIASYNTNKDGIVENVIYSATNENKNETPISFKLMIEKTAKGYKQIIPDMVMNDGQSIKLTEEYESVGTADKSPLDGNWKQTRSYYVNGKDSTETKLTQFKTYYAGYVIWGHTYADSANKSHTAIGFGKFKMNGKNKLKESMMTSTYDVVRGKEFEIDIEMKGSDEYKQINYNKDGSKGVEIYQRLKKP